MMKLYVIAFLLASAFADSYSQVQCITPTSNCKPVTDKGISGGCSTVDGGTTFNCPNESDFQAFGTIYQATEPGTAGCGINNTYNELPCTLQSDPSTCTRCCS
jgi:hypothetical protein